MKQDSTLTPDGLVGCGAEVVPSFAADDVGFAIFGGGLGKCPYELNQFIGVGGFGHGPGDGVANRHDERLRSLVIEMTMLRSQSFAAVFRIVLENEE